MRNSLDSVTEIMFELRLQLFTHIHNYSVAWKRMNDVKVNEWNSSIYIPYFVHSLYTVHIYGFKIKGNFVIGFAKKKQR